MNAVAGSHHDREVIEWVTMILSLVEWVSESPKALPLTDPQREELDRRLDDLERSGPEGIPWDWTFAKSVSNDA
jgi:putative addiction module component (TIGR02574 family)